MSRRRSFLFGNQVVPRFAARAERQLRSVTLVTEAPIKPGVALSIGSTVCIQASYRAKAARDEFNGLRAAGVLEASVKTNLEDQSSHVKRIQAGYRAKAASANFDALRTAVSR